MNKRKALLLSLVVVLLALGILFVLLWSKSPHMSVTFYVGTTLQLQSSYLDYLTITIQGAPSNTLFTWALYENHQVQGGTYQWFFVEGTGSVNTISPDSTDGNGHCSWQIPIVANRYEKPNAIPSPIDGWPPGQYEIKVTVTCPAPVTSSSVSEDSDIVWLIITPSP